FGLRTLASPPCASTARSSPASPENAAACTGVSPRASTRLGSAPPSSSAVTLAVCPARIAAISRVLPSLPGVSASIRSSWRRISGASPRSTAAAREDSSGFEKASLLMVGWSHPAALQKRSANAIADTRRMRGKERPIIAPWRKSMGSAYRPRSPAEQAADEPAHAGGRIGHALGHPAGAVRERLDHLPAGIGDALDHV